MKDLPHHIKKFVRRILRSEQREKADAEEWEAQYQQEKSKKQKKKQ